MSLFLNLKRIGLSLVIALGVAYGAKAHEVKAGPNGGPLTDLGEIHLELVMKADKIDLFVTDAEGSPVYVSTASANLIILAGTKKHVVKLGPVADSILGESFSIPDAGPYTVVAVVVIPGKKPFQGRFTLPELLAFLDNTTRLNS